MNRTQVKRKVFADSQQQVDLSFFSKLNALRVTALVLFALTASQAAMASEQTRLACMEKSGSRSDEADCNEREIGALRKEQRNVLRQIESELTKCTPTSEAYDYKTALTQLRSATTSWTAFVKRDCEVISLTYGVGTGAGSAFAHCHINHLRTRNTQLSHLLRDMQTTRESLLGNNADSGTKNSFISCIGVN